MFFFAYNFFPPFLSYYVVDASGAIVKQVGIDMPAPVMMHDMLITENYSVFMDSPIVFDMDGLANGESMVKWKRENGTRLGIIPRHGDAEDVRWFEVPTSHVQHFWNAWENGNRIELSGVRFEEVDFGIESEASDKESGVETNAGSPGQVLDRPRHRHRGQRVLRRLQRRVLPVQRRPHRTRDQLRSTCRASPGPTPMPGDFDTVVKYDTKTDTRSLWYSGDHGHVGEGVFAPDPAGSAEDDGWIVNSMHNTDTGQSEVIVLDARRIEDGPDRPCADPAADAVRLPRQLVRRELSLRPGADRPAARSCGRGPRDPT